MIGFGTYCSRRRLPFPEGQISLLRYKKENGHTRIELRHQHELDDVVVGSGTNPTSKAVSGEHAPDLEQCLVRCFETWAIYWQKVNQIPITTDIHRICGDPGVVVGDISR